MHTTDESGDVCPTELYKATLELIVAIGKAAQHVAAAHGMDKQEQRNLLNMLRAAIQSFPPGQFQQIDIIAYYESKLRTYESLLDYRRMRIHSLEQELASHEKTPKAP